MRYELKPLNIKVKLVEPGVVKTNIYHSVFDFPFEQYPNDYKNFKKWHSFFLKNYKNSYSPALDAKTIYKAVTSKKTQDKAKEVWDDTKDAANKAADKTKETLDKAGDKAKEVWDTTKNAVKTGAEKVKNELKNN